MNTKLRKGAQPGNTNGIHTVCSALSTRLSSRIAPSRPESMIETCEHAIGAEIPFDNILDRVTGSDPSITDYILETPARCPNCCRQILEKTLIEPALSSS